ncbi:hypothetical protein DIURU_004954 [Diutina rugosa]|uniref:Altered inheritance of mitochondria protein 24, mitochondrial n=1 Tax=Diutina rugosa TaxID=5481 RepID=A0A642UFR5_DIURU|nr:uncharacterized protein DIURU_004954 [Diutina rugosa]KAA8898100.1 hypothetical protein DIURU_004954 [Diutina rugosa]
MRLSPRLWNQLVPIAQRPSVSGNGPFVELPRFKTVGEPSRMLNVTIPASGCVNIRSGFMIGVDGDVNGIMSTATNHNGLEYHAIQPLKSVSVLIAGRSANYALLDNTDNEQWTVLDQRHIIAWSGLNFDLIPTMVLSRLASYQGIGVGTLVVNCDEIGNLYNVEVRNGENFLINPNAIIATTTPIEYKVLKKARVQLDWSKWLPHISLPRSGLFGTLGVRWDDIKEKIITKETRQFFGKLLICWHECKQWVSHKILRRIHETPIYAQVKGPAKLLLNTKSSVANRKMFTNSEIDYIRGHKI